MKIKKLVKDSLMARARSTSDLPTSPQGRDLGQRIDARLHDLSQLQLESGKKLHHRVSRTNNSKNSNSNLGNKGHPLEKGHAHNFNNNDDSKPKGTSEPCPLHPNIDPRMYESQMKSIATSSSYCNCEGEGCRSLNRTRSSPPMSSQGTTLSTDANSEPYFFDRRWRACKCANITNRSNSGVDIHELEAMRNKPFNHNALAHRRSFIQSRSRDSHYRANLKLNNSNYPSQYYPDLSPIDMCYLLQGDHDPVEKEDLDVESSSHCVNTAFTIRDIQLLLLQENYQDGPANLSQENSNKCTNRRWQDQLDAGTLSSANCRVSEERLSRIANWHHLPRVSMERAKLMRSISNDHIPSPFSSSFHVNYQNYRNQKRYNRGAPSTMVKRSESVQHESSTCCRRLSNTNKDQAKGNFELRNVRQNHHVKADKINGNRAIHESAFLSHNDKVASAKTYSDKKPKPFIGAGNNKELDHALSSETTSGETDTYEDSSSMSLPDSIDGDGQSLIERNGPRKVGSSTKPYSTKKNKSNSIQEEDEIAMNLMREEDLSFQLLQDADTVHKYVASRGQREKEEDIYEVFPPTITVRHRSTRIIRHR